DSLLPIDTLAAIRPHVHCKASDYLASELPEAAMVEQLGGTTKILPHVSGYSSSQIVERVLTRSAAAPNESGGLTSGSADDVYRLMLAGSNVLRQTAWNLKTRVTEAADIIGQALQENHKILICG